MILGSTGSIGSQTLDVIRQHKDKFKIKGVSTYKSIEKIEQQMEEFQIENICIVDKEKADIFEDKNKISVLKGADGLKKLAQIENDVLVNSVVGIAGLEPTIEGIKHTKRLAIANKETLVVAGDLVIPEAKKHQTELLPIDSEHSALFQCLQGNKKEDIKRLIITCSGGSFRDTPPEKLKEMTAKEALNHPNWSMGAKITIDSATLFNKGLEVIEAHFLFDMPYEKIETVMHPQSIIHSMIEYKDGSIMAQLGQHDMRIPIIYSLSYPERWDLNIEKLDFVKLKELTFRQIDHQTFPALNLAYTVGKKGGTARAVMNGANEEAVYLFLDNKIKFLDIYKYVKEAVDKHNFIQNPDLDELLKADKWAREYVRGRVNE